MIGLVYQPSRNLSRALALAVVVCMCPVLRAEAKTKNSTGGSDSGCAGCVSEAASLFARGNNLQAAELLKQWTDRCPSNTQLHLLYSNILIRQGAFTQAEDEAARAADANPASVSANMQYAITLMSNNKNMRAVQYFRKVTELDSSNFEAWSALQGLYQKLHDDEAARACAARVQSLGSGTRTQIQRTVENLRKAGKYTQARKLLDDMLQSPDTSLELLQDMCSEALSIGAFDQAIALGQRVAKTYPRSVLPLVTIALAQYCTGDYKGCLATSEKLSSLDAADLDGLSLKALCLSRQGHYSEAEPLARKALLRQPDSALARLAMGSAQSGQGDTIAAEESFHDCLNSDASGSAIGGLADPLVHLELSRLHRAKNNITAAISEARMAGADKRFEAPSLTSEALALIAESQGPATLLQAEKLTQQAASLAPDNAETALARARILDKQGAGKEALKYYHDSLDHGLSGADADLARAAIAKYEGKH